MVGSSVAVYGAAAICALVYVDISSNVPSILREARAHFAFQRG
jgi:hypothetical protein